MNNDHSKRAHALISPSSLYRDLVCTAAPLLTADMPDTSSPYAKEGTYAHELCELMIRQYILKDLSHEEFAAEWEMVAGQAKDEGFDPDEMFRHASAYLEYVQGIFLSFPEEPFLAVEARLNLSGWIPDGFGTADCILIGGDRMVVIDFKYGKSPAGRVDAEKNPQMIAYALGAYYEFGMMYDVRNVEMHIFQPRIPDGISDYTMSLMELLSYGDYIRLQVNEALSGNGKFAPGPKVCKFCKAKDLCKARAEANLALEPMAQTLKPGLMTPEEIAEAIRIGEDLQTWLEDVKERALKDCLDGKIIPGYKAVEGRGSREWTDMDQAFKILQDAGIDEAVLYERKPLTLAATEKAVGKKRFAELVGSLTQKTPGKPALVPESDKRPAMTNKKTAAEVFGTNND